MSNQINLSSSEMMAKMVSKDVVDDMQSKVTKNVNFRGRTVTVRTDMKSLLTDAAEEMSFKASSRLQKELKDRQIKDGKNRLQMLEKIKQYLNKVSDIESKQNLMKLLNHTSKLVFSNVDTLLNYLKDSYGDVSHQFIVLDSLATLLSSEVEELSKKKFKSEELEKKRSLLKLVQQGLASLEDDFGPEIRAGINIGQLKGEKLSETSQGLRDFYRASVLGYDSLSGAYSYILERYSINRFQNAIEYLLSALALDMDSDGSSIPKAKLVDICGHMNRLKIVNSLYNESIMSLDVLRRSYE